MNCPKCGEPLRISKKDPAFGLCNNCKKKFRLPETVAPASPTSSTKISVDDVPAKAPSKQLMDETRVMKAIQNIDGVAEDHVNEERPLPKKRRPQQPSEDVREKESRPRPAAKKRPTEKRVPERRSSEKRVPEKKQAPAKKHPQKGYYTDDQYGDEPHHKKKKYANIPPSKVRSSREDEMRSGYDELLAIENEKQGIGSKILTVIVLLIVLALIGCGAFYLYHRVSSNKSSSAIDTASVEKSASIGNIATEDEIAEVLYVDDEITVMI
ncbi:MAG: hypothetical protein PHW34_16910 [Hespellia sp.]|nr:hypothetical protein [Hespellia sp.]